MTLFLDARLSPQLQDLGLARARGEIQQRIHDELLLMCDEGLLDCSDLLCARTDEAGRVTAIETDTEKLNRLRSLMVERISGAVDQKRSFTLSVPAGSLTDSGLLSWLSLPIRVRYAPLGAVAGEICTEFSGSGINQTRYAVYARIEVDVTLLLPGENPVTSAAVTVPLGETVVVGQVPRLVGTV
ncbi:MAG: sporulation protein YunB [Clostridia bacterium]|nr:sporulation protein YunB [Clostridia bacterium]